jgi:serine/threonine protein kinase
MHRDVAVKNILYDGSDAILADFGLACKYIDGEEYPGCGTMPYMAPEVVWGPSKYDVSVDMWSAGIVFSYLVCIHVHLQQKKSNNCTSLPGFWKALVSC